MLRFLRSFGRSSPQNIWAASVYLRGADLIIHAQNRSYNNCGWNSEPVVKTNVALSPSEIGALVRSVLQASRWDAEAPDPDRQDNPILKAAGVRSWRQLERESRLVGIALQNEQISVCPYRATRPGEGEGFLVMDDAATTQSAHCSDEELGAAVLDGLNRAVPWRPAC